MLVTDGVPARIVMAGTSEMKLNDRFSKLPARKTITKVGRFVTRPRLTFAKNREVLSYNAPHNRLYENYGERQGSSRIFRSRSSRLADRIHIPIEQRLSVVQKPKLIYANRRLVNKSGNFHRGGQRFNINRNGQVNKGFRRENNNLFGGERGRFHKNNQFNINRGNANKDFNKNKNKMTSEELSAYLDRDLEDYMRKPNLKHPRITV